MKPIKSPPAWLDPLTNTTVIANSKCLLRRLVLQYKLIDVVWAFQRTSNDCTKLETLTMRGSLLKVKDKFGRRRKDSVVDDASRSNTDDSTGSVPLSFLRLPAEVRNNIYQYLAGSTTLVLSPERPKKRPPPVGLLSACKQTHHEYRPILMSNAALVIRVHSYNFGVVVRTFEQLKAEDLALVRLNPQLLIHLYLGHVPSRDDRKALRAWCDYRVETTAKTYFGPGQRIPRDVVFQYEVKFLSHMRPPRPHSRYATGHEMNLDLLRTHVRMTSRLQAPGEEPNFELIKLREDLDERVNQIEAVIREGKPWVRPREDSIAAYST